MNKRFGFAADHQDGNSDHDDIKDDLQHLTVRQCMHRVLGNDVCKYVPCGLLRRHSDVLISKVHSGKTGAGTNQAGKHQCGGYGQRSCCQIGNERQPTYAP